MVSNSQLTTRCAFCGDSQKSSYSTHMYIGLPYDGRPISYYCQRCNVGGFVNDKFFKQYDIHNLDLRSSVIKNLREQLGKGTIRRSSDKFSTRREYNHYDWESEVYREFYHNKIEYLNSRLKVDLNIQGNLEKYRIVLSPYNFLSAFNYEEVTEDEEDRLYFDQYYVGFLTSDGSRLVLRCILDNPDFRRYHHITLFQTESPVYYSSKKNIDTSKKITINLTEGIFDIINIENSNLDVSDNSINIAVLGKDYASKIEHLVEIIGSIFMIDKINIYSDNDVKPKWFYYRLRQVKHLRNKINIFKNVTSDDFGDKNVNFVLSEIKVNL